MTYNYKPKIYIIADTGEVLNKAKVKEKESELEVLKSTREFKETPWGITNVYTTVFMKKTNTKQLTFNF